MQVPAVRRVAPSHRILTLPQSAPLPHPSWAAVARKAVRSAFAFLKIEDPTVVELLFVDESAIRALNSSARGRDSVTDVLSFPALSLTPGQQPRRMAGAADWTDGRIALGSIVICTQRALAQADEYGHSPIREFAFLAAHSALHLLGYDHETSSEDEKRMFALQEQILKAANILR